MSGEDKPSEDTTTTTVAEETTTEESSSPSEEEPPKTDDVVADNNKDETTTTPTTTESNEDEKKEEDVVDEDALKAEIEEVVEEVSKITTGVDNDDDYDVGRDKKDDVYATSLESSMMIFKKMISDACDLEESRINNIASIVEKQPTRQQLFMQNIKSTVAAAQDSIKKGVNKGETSSSDGAGTNSPSTTTTLPMKNKWKLEHSPYKQFNKKLDDVYYAFLKWSSVKTGENGNQIKVNISKAFRRLESYANWFNKKHVHDLTNLTAESIEPTYNLFNMKVTISPNTKQFVWWFDMTTVDINDIKSISIQETFRLFVWISHVALFSSDAQDNGMVMYFNLNKTGFIQLMKLFPIKLSIKLDRLTIGVLPIKMKCLYLMDTPKWMSVIINMIKPFLSKKIKQRIVILNKPQLIDEMKMKLNDDCIPSSFSVLDGKASDNDDYIVSNYFANLATTTTTTTTTTTETTTTSVDESDDI